MVFMLITACTVSVIRTLRAHTNAGFHEPWRKTLPVKWHFDCSFQEDLKSDARAGFDYWNEQLGLNVFQEDESCDAASGIALHYSDEASVEGAMRIAQADPSLKLSGHIYFFKPWTSHGDSVWRITTARHEIGHIIGLRHSKNPECLMFPDQILYEADGRMGKVLADGGYLNPVVPKDLCDDELQVVKKEYDLQ